MSLETGKKLGFAASIISFIIPIVVGIVYISFFLSLFNSLSSTISGGFASGLSSSSMFSLALLGVLVGVGIVGFIGYVFYMVSMYNLSKYYHEPGIFRNLLTALVVSIVGSTIVGILFVAIFAVAIGTSFPIATSSTAFPIIWSLLAIGGLIVWVFVMAIINGVLTRRAFNLLADKSGVETFRTAGLLFLIGSFVTLVGYVAWIFAAMGYRKLTPTPPANAYFAPQYVTSPNGPVKLCPNCGTTNNPDAIYCLSCGKQFS
jgi:uncharacterized membrane protein